MVEGYRVRFDGREVRCDLEGLFVLAEAGKVVVDTEVSKPGEADFQRADSLSELAGRLKTADPWSAWDEMESATSPWEDARSAAAISEDDDPDDDPDDDDPDDDLDMDTQIMRSPVTSSVRTLTMPLVLEPVLSDADIAPLEEPGVAQGGEPPAAEDASVDSAAGEEAAPGQVIAFPSLHSHRDPSASGGYALDDRPLHRLPPPPLPDLQRTLRKPPRYTATLSYLRLCMLVVIGVLLLLVGRAYVLDTARMVLPPHPSTASQGAADSVTEPLIDPYAMLESELRAQMSLDLLEVTSESTFEEALFIELGRVKLDVASVRVTATDWAGRNRDVPKSAEFRLRLRFRSGELDRELAAVGLVLGKYIQRYSLEVPYLEVVMASPEGGEAKMFQLEPDSARRFYIQRVDLKEYLEEGLKP